MRVKVLLGTRNPAKVHIVRAALRPLPIEVLTPSDLGIELDVREDGRTTGENAAKKARAYYAEAGIPTVAIDGGLWVERFPEDGQPGVTVRRIGGGQVTDDEVLAHYAKALAEVGGRSAATWKGSIALVTAGGKLLADSYSYRAILTAQRRGDPPPGAPLDAVTVDPETGRYYTEVSWAERPDARWVYAFFQRHMSQL